MYTSINTGPLCMAHLSGTCSQCMLCNYAVGCGQQEWAQYDNDSVLTGLENTVLHCSTWILHQNAALQAGGRKWCIMRGGKFHIGEQHDWYNWCREIYSRGEQEKMHSMNIDMCNQHVLTDMHDWKHRQGNTHESESMRWINDYIVNMVMDNRAYLLLVERSTTLLY